MRQKFFHFAPVRAKQMSPGHPEILYEGRWNFYCRKTAGQEKLSSFLLPCSLISQLLYLFYLPTNMATGIYPWRKAYFPFPLPSTTTMYLWLIPLTASKELPILLLKLLE